MGYTKTNLERDVENQAPNFGMPEEMEARFARSAIGAETLGLSFVRLAPGFRIPFGHKHEGQEEVYVVVRGSARVKVDDEIVELGVLDALRFDKDTMRAVEAGPDGVEYVAFGAGDDPRDAEMVQGVVERLTGRSDDAQTDLTTAFVRSAADGAIEIVVNFGPLSGREATLAEVDRLGRRLLEIAERVHVQAVRSHDMSAHSETIVHQIVVEAVAASAHASGLRDVCETWAAECAAERSLEPLAP